mmetsp:Transcript_26968/g.49957  ORF Transcript_26968/g.49957 Transcript_26968/m.49957 type:complete len:135 (-) Transcript_26968:1415-1819(-)
MVFVYATCESLTMRKHITLLLDDFIPTVGVHPPAYMNKLLHVMISASSCSVTARFESEPSTTTLYCTKPASYPLCFSDEPCRRRPIFMCVEHYLPPAIPPAVGRSIGCAQHQACLMNRMDIFPSRKRYIQCKEV